MHQFQLKTKTHSVTQDKSSALDLWNRPDKIGGYLITKKYWDKNGNLADFNHCKRILGLTVDMLELMNPRQISPDVVVWKWDVMVEWQAYVLIVQK